MTNLISWESCVCHTLYLRVSTSQLFQAGGHGVRSGTMSNEATWHTGSTERRLGVYLLNCFHKLLHGLIHGCSHDTSLKPFLCRVSCSWVALSLATADMSTDCSNNTSVLTLSPCGSITIFDRGTELTENPLSKCVPLRRPTWMHSVIPVTGAPSHTGVPLTDFFRVLHSLDYLNGLSFHHSIPKNLSRRASGIATELPRRRAYGHIYVTHTHSSTHPPNLQPNAYCYPTCYLG